MTKLYLKENSDSNSFEWIHTITHLKKRKIRKKKPLPLRH